MLELYFNFFTKIRDTDKYEEMEMDTDSLYLAIAERHLHDCIRGEKIKSGNCCVARTVMIRSLQTLAAFLFFECFVLNTENMTKQSLDCSRLIINALKCCVYVAKHTAVTIRRATALIAAENDVTSDHLKTVETCHGKISIIVGREGNCNFYQSSIPHKKLFCSKL